MKVILEKTQITNKTFDYVVLDEGYRNLVCINTKNYKRFKKDKIEEVNKFFKKNHKQIESTKEIKQVLEAFFENQFDLLDMTAYWITTFLWKEETEVSFKVHKTLVWALLEYMSIRNQIVEEVIIDRIDYLEHEMHFTFSWFQQVRFQLEKTSELLKRFTKWSYDEVYKEKWMIRKDIKSKFWIVKMKQKIFDFLLWNFSEKIYSLKDDKIEFSRKFMTDEETTEIYTTINLLLMLNLFYFEFVKFEDNWKKFILTFKK